MPMIEQRERTRTQRFIYRCKRHHITKALDIEVRAVTSIYQWPSDGRLERQTVRRYNGEQNPPAIPCPECGRYMDSAQVRAYVSDHVCDARCTNAVGPDCECSCGGANHGSAHL